MKVVRSATAIAMVFALSLAAPNAHAGPTPDQRCEGSALGSASGTTYTQTFTPTAPTLTRVDVHLMSQRKRGPEPLRLRVVRKRSVGAGLAAQLIVLGEQEIRLPLQPRRRAWATVRFPTPIALTSAAPVTDQLAIELALPKFDNTLKWIGCTKYDRGHASFGHLSSAPSVDPSTLAPYGLDKGLTVTEDFSYDLDFITYG